jgi:hypothetical protein
MMPRSCPYVLFSYYSHICAFCLFIALYSPLIFLQQRLPEIFDSGQEMRCVALSLHFLICLVPKLCKNRFAHSTFTLSFMFLLSYSMPWFCSCSWFILFQILGSLFIREAENSFTSKPGWYYIHLSHFTIILFALWSSWFDTESLILKKVLWLKL